VTHPGHHLSVDAGYGLQQVVTPEGYHQIIGVRRIRDIARYPLRPALRRYCQSPGQIPRLSPPPYPSPSAVRKPDIIPDNSNATAPWRRRNHRADSRWRPGNGLSRPRYRFLDRIVAIKVINQSVNDDPEYLETLRREVRLDLYPGYNWWRNVGGGGSNATTSPAGSWWFTTPINISMKPG
jgi:hypothetical protein